MPARVITLPIKCSTIKKVSSILECIIDIEFVICAIAFIAWEVTFWYRIAVAPYSFYPNYSDATFYCLVNVAGLIVASYFCVDWAIANFPRLECIKDEKEE
jgi:hypothetical protein